MKILEMKQGSDEWHEARKGKFTGSTVWNIIPKRWTAPKAGFWQTIADQVAEDPDDENPMDRGSRLEDEAIARFESETGKTIRQVGLCVADFNETIAISPDGLIGDNEAIEVKCLNSASHIQAYYTQKIPLQYFDQCLQYFIVHEELETLYFAMYDPRVTAIDFFYITMRREDYERQINGQLQSELEYIKKMEEIILQLTF